MRNRYFDFFPQSAGTAPQPAFNKPVMSSRSALPTPCHPERAQRVEGSSRLRRTDCDPAPKKECHSEPSKTAWNLSDCGSLSSCSSAGEKRHHTAIGRPFGCAQGDAFFVFAGAQSVRRNRQDSTGAERPLNDILFHCVPQPAFQADAIRPYRTRPYL